jgi:hypothetical protein
MGAKEKGEPQIDADVRRFGLETYSGRGVRSMMWLRIRIQKPRTRAICLVEQFPNSHTEICVIRLRKAYGATGSV